MTIQKNPKPMTPEEAARAEQAYILRTYAGKTFLQIAEQLGYGGAIPASTAMKAVQRFDDEIQAGQRELPIDPDKKRRRASEQIVRNVTRGATRPPVT